MSQPAPANPTTPTPPATQATSAIPATPATPPTNDAGVFDARYLAFLETITNLRPKLHRYCARMIGSVLDGEDVVQETLFQAYRKLETFDDARPLAPWLFRIAHNHCIDFLRRRGVRVEAEAAAALEADTIVHPEAPRPAIGPAVEHLVLTLPPRERACVLLKDVFDYSLDEIAELIDSTAGAVKAALNRGRSKLTAAASSPTSASSPASAYAPASTSRPASASVPASTSAPASASPRVPDGTKPHARGAANEQTRRVLQQYVQHFNARDWEGVRSLIAADARVRVADRLSLKNCAQFIQAPVDSIKDSPYFGRYARMATAWRLEVVDIDGEPAILRLDRTGDERWAPFSLIRLEVAGDHVQQIVDYSHCPWVIDMAGVPATDVSSLEPHA